MAVINEKYPIDRALVTTYQAISGAGKTFETWPEMVDNIIPYISGEEEGNITFYDQTLKLIKKKNYKND